MAEAQKSPSEGRLDSWKGIAAYLNRDVRTVQRWEKEEGLPVHRHAHKKLGTVYAFQTEIDTWSSGRALTPGAPEGAPIEGPFPVPRRSWLWLAPVLGLLICAGFVALRLAPRSETGSLVYTQLTTDVGLTWQPALSPKGDLVAYASDRESDGNLDLWVQRTSRSTPRRLTNHEADDIEPAFSPDGTKVVFRSEREGGGIYVVPVTGGQAEKIADGGRRPRYSPDGKWIAYWAGHRPHMPGHIFVTPSEGGLHRALGASLVARSPVWTPDGKHLVVQGWFPADIEGEPTPNLNPADWFVISLDGGPTVSTGALQAFHQAGLSTSDGYPNRFYPDAWIANSNEVVFSAKLGDSTNLWKISISPQTWKVAGQPQRLTSGTGMELHSSASAGSGLAFSSLTRNHDIWSLPVDASRSKILGGIQQLTRSAADDVAPSVSADGKRLAFESTRSGKRLVWTKDLETGREAALTDTPSGESLPRIAADGSRVAYSVGGMEKAGTVADIYVVPFVGGQARNVCGKCGYAWSWSPDSAKLLYGNGKSMSVLEVDGSKRYKIIEVPGYEFWSGRFSWDQQWISFAYAMPRKQTSPAVARFRDAEQLRKNEWIQMAEGDHHPWSPDGSLVYFASRRDGLLCFWSSRLNPETKQPIGLPEPVYHFHRARLSLPDDPDWLGISVARDKIVFGLRELTGNIWIATPRPAR